MLNYLSGSNTERNYGDPSQLMKALYLKSLYLNGGTKSFRRKNN